MEICLNKITWGSLAAIATSVAVIVALIPIWRDAFRKRAHAKSLRFRLCSKLVYLLPSFQNIVNDGSSKYQSTILSKEDFKEVVSSIELMLQESSVLKTDEQDCIGILFVNLQMASGVYNTKDMTKKGAQLLIELINNAISKMEKRGLLNKKPEVPWEPNNSKS